MAARSSRCEACDARTTSHTGYCQSCKSRRHRGYKLLKEEGLLLDEAGGAWWIWDARGDVVVSGKPTKVAAIIALGGGDVEDDADDGPAHGHAKKKSSAQIGREIAAVLAGRRSDHATKKTGGGGLRHWKVRFTRRGMEPPRPFGKTTVVVCAESRAAAREMVPASPHYPITATATTDPVTFTYRCHHAADEEIDA